MKDDTLREHYACRVCGFHPRSRAGWCASGCGSDYNEMVELKGLRNYVHSQRKEAELETLEWADENLTRKEQP